MAFTRERDICLDRGSIARPTVLKPPPKALRWKTVRNRPKIPQTAAETGRTAGIQRKHSNAKTSRRFRAWLISSASSIHTAELSGVFLKMSYLPVTATPAAFTLRCGRFPATIPSYEFHSIPGFRYKRHCLRVGNRISIPNEITPGEPALEYSPASAPFAPAGI